MEDRSMKTVMTACLALAMVAGLAAAQAPAPTFTRVTLEDIHCMRCAKKIAGKVTAVPGVAEMRVDLKAKTIWAVHKPGATPSPKAVWEAVEAADHTPTRMDTAAGSYTAKPAS
jgi:copper chaperone CopZ